jgi:hypothetical protein
MGVGVGWVFLALMSRHCLIPWPRYLARAHTDTQEKLSRDIMSDLKIRDTNKITILKNKPPRWNETTQSHCLNFGGRVTQPSIKNFQLIAEGSGGWWWLCVCVCVCVCEAPSLDRHESNTIDTHTHTHTRAETNIILQFGRCGPDYFTVDLQWPLTPVEGFAIALTTFDAYDNA